MNLGNHNETLLVGTRGGIEPRSNHNETLLTAL